MARTAALFALSETSLWKAGALRRRGEKLRIDETPAADDGLACPEGGVLGRAFLWNMAWEVMYQAAG